MVLDKNTEHLATFHLRSKRHEEKNRLRGQKSFSTSRVGFDFISQLLKNFLL